MTVERRNFTVAEAVQMSGLSRITWYRWIANGWVHSVRFGARVMIPKAELDRVLTEGQPKRLPVNGQNSSSRQQRKVSATA